MSPSLKAVLAEASLVLLNGCPSWVLGRKLVIVDQRTHWQQRVNDWQQEVAGMIQDPYYSQLDCRLIETLSQLSDVKRFLEVGCFFGYRLSKVRAAFADALVVGVDIVREALRRAQDASDDASTMRLVHGDAAILPFRSGSVDCVYTVVCLTHVPGRLVQAALDEILRVTRRYVVLIEVYDQLMTLRNRLRVHTWPAGYCHRYEDLLARRSLRRILVEGLRDSAGHPRYTLFVYEKVTP